jgi:uncharacterized protein YndB with AHSA1/START domain
MPEFDDEVLSSASPIAVWKLLYNPMRFPEWWAGFADVTPGDARGGAGDVTLWLEGYPDFPLPQRIHTAADEHRVVVSCTVSDLVFEWRLEPVENGTRIRVHAEIPEREAARVAPQREVVASSLRRLSALAESATGVPRTPG